MMCFGVTLDKGFSRVTPGDYTIQHFLMLYRAFPAPDWPRAPFITALLFADEKRPKLCKFILDR